MKLSTLILMGVLGLSISFSASASVLVNGSFENHTSGVPDSWTTSGNLGITSTQGESNGSFALAFSLGNLVSNGVLSQTFTTLPGQSYILSFDFGKYAVAQPTTVARLIYDVFDGSGFAGGTLLNGTVTDSTPANSTDSPDVYDPFSFGFVAVGTSATLRFTDTSDPQTAGGGFDAMLDNVAVISVPEPTRAGLLITSACGLFLRRRRIA